MMSLETIRSMSREVAEKAASNKLYPFTVEEEDIRDWKTALVVGKSPRLPFPDLGDYRPEGWELVDDLLCDSTGMGADNEPALTIRQLLDRLTAGRGYAVVESGQFQVVLGEFKKV